MPRRLLAATLLLSLLASACDRDATPTHVDLPASAAPASSASARSSAPAAESAAAPSEPSSPGATREHTTTQLFLPMACDAFGRTPDERVVIHPQIRARCERGTTTLTPSERRAALEVERSPRDSIELLIVDGWGRPYVYACTRDSVTIRSRGSDGVANTSDDLTAVCPRSGVTRAVPRRAGALELR